MQLDDLKAIWQKQSLPAGFREEALDEAQLTRMLHTKATDSLAKINKGFLWEIGVYILTVLAITVLGFFRSNDSLILFCLAVVCLGMLACGGAMWQKYQQLGRLGATSANLSTSLDAVILFLQRFNRQYIYIKTLSGVLSFTFGLVIGMTSKPGRLLEDVLQKPKVWYILIPVCIVGWVSLYFISEKVVYLVYGKHLQNLEKSRQELQQLE